MHWVFSSRSRLTISIWSLPPINCSFGGRLGFLSIFSLFSRSGFWSSNRQAECLMRLIVDELSSFYALLLIFTLLIISAHTLVIIFSEWGKWFLSTTVLLHFFARLEPLLWRSFIFTAIFWTIRNLLIRDTSCGSSLWSRLVFLPYVLFLGFSYLWFMQNDILCHSITAYACFKVEFIGSMKIYMYVLICCLCYCSYSWTLYIISSGRMSQLYFLIGNPRSINFWHRGSWSISFKSGRGQFVKLFL